MWNSLPPARSCTGKVADPHYLNLSPQIVPGRVYRRVRLTHQVMTEEAGSARPRSHFVTTTSPSPSPSPPLGERG